MNLLAALLVVTSHVWAALPFLRRVRRRELPTVPDFACVGIAIYYDAGLILDATGLLAQNEFFAPFFEAPGPALALLVPLLMAAPWLVRVGAGWVRPAPEVAVRDAAAPPPAPIHPPAAPPPREPGTRGWRAFVVLAILVSAPIAWLGWKLVSEYAGIAAARAALGEDLGLAVMVLYFPLHLLAYAVSHPSSRTRGGIVVLVLLAAAAIVATLPIGQRTNALLPAIILGLFAWRPSLRSLLALGLGGALAASALLGIFKQRDDTSLRENVAITAVADFYRANVLAHAWARSELLGTRLMPYAGSGYVYSALFFVPRSVAPWKGHSTSAHLTARAVDDDPEALDWALQCGVIEELMLNLGILAVLPGLLLTGAVLALLQRWSEQRPALAVPTRLGAIWAFGYTLPAVLLTFGTMLAVILTLTALISQRTDHPAGRAEAQRT